MDLVSARPDIVYLRRRLKLGETPPVAEVAANFLSISGSDDIMPVDLTLPDKPQAAGRTVLTASSPVVRLNPRQSAIGSLRAAGVTTFAWETQDRRSGLQGPSGTTSPDMPVFANRRLVERFEGETVVGLRHFAVLRRLILGADSGEVTLTLHGGATIAADTRGGRDVLYLSVIGQILEVRLETLATGEDIATTFNIGR